MRGHRNLKNHQTPSTSTVDGVVFAAIGYSTQKNWNQNKPFPALMCLKPCSKNQSIAIQTMLNNVFKNYVCRMIYGLLFQVHWRMQSYSSASVSWAGVLSCVHLLLYPGVTLGGKDFLLIHPILPLRPCSGFSETLWWKILFRIIKLLHS